jgi:hypothetical protein
MFLDTHSFFRLIQHYLEERKMRTLKILILFFIAFSLLGCTTYSNDHYSLMPEPESSKVHALSNTLKIKIEPILKRHGLKDARSNKTPENVLLYYSTGGYSALRVGVRVHNGMIVLDSFQYRSGAGDSADYTQLRDELIYALREIEGVKVVEVDGPAI